MDLSAEKPPWKQPAVLAQVAAGAAALLLVTLTLVFWLPARCPGCAEDGAEVAELRSELRVRLDSLQSNLTALQQMLELLRRQGSEQEDRTAALQEEQRRLREDFEHQRSSLQEQMWELQGELEALRRLISRGSPAAAPGLTAALGLAALALVAPLLR